MPRKLALRHGTIVKTNVMDQDTACKCVCSNAAIIAAGIFLALLFKYFDILLNEENELLAMNDFLPIVTPMVNGKANSVSSLERWTEMQFCIAAECVGVRVIDSSKRKRLPFLAAVAFCVAYGRELVCKVHVFLSYRENVCF